MYKFNKEVYEVKQNGASISDYYTKMKCLWVEIDAMGELPIITEVTQEIRELLKTLSKQREEQKLFQFLNRLDEIYNPQRSQLLMLHPLPSVESSCSMLQQEESQREVLNFTLSSEPSALYNKSDQRSFYDRDNRSFPDRDQRSTCDRESRFVPEQKTSRR